jgi:hypothetical protein
LAEINFVLMGDMLFLHLNWLLPIPIFR